MAWQSWLWVAMGGALGATARYGMGLALHPDRVPQAIPYGTLAVNILGSLLLGYLFATLFGDPKARHDTLWLLTGVGFCGAFTTMSTFSLETLTLLQRNHLGAALGNIALQLVLCLGGAGLGMWLGKR